MLPRNNKKHGCTWRISVLFCNFAASKVSLHTERKADISTNRNHSDAKKMTTTQHHHHRSHHRSGFYDNASSRKARRRKKLNKMMKIVMTFFALAIVGLVCWLYSN